MFTILLFFHSIIRWFVLASLLTAIYRAYNGYTKKLPFQRVDNTVRHWTATIAHIQLVLGIYIYTQSDTVKSLFNGGGGKGITNPVFFGAIHISMMMIAIVVITIGSAKAKRRSTDHDKFKVMLTWYGVALALIFIAIPWPFSPLAQRPYLRSF